MPINPPPLATYKDLTDHSASIQAKILQIETELASLREQVVTVGAMAQDTAEDLVAVIDDVTEHDNEITQLMVEVEQLKTDASTFAAMLVEHEQKIFDTEQDVANLEDRVSALENNGEPGHKVFYGAIDAARGYDGLENALSDATGISRPNGTLVRGFSGSGHPATFDTSSVASAKLLGLAAMLNTKRDWRALVAGDYDNLIRGFFNSWPVEVRGDVTINHEPSNDMPIVEGQDNRMSLDNPRYVNWIRINGPIWCDGIRRYIDLAAPIIRARGLDVKIGGCMMDFDWDSDRWQYFKWWEGLNTENINEVTFGVDAYVKHLPNPPHGADIKPRINELVEVMRGAGIKHFSLFETAVDKRQYTTGALIGTDQTVADWLLAYETFLNSIPEMRTVCHFHDPAGPASGKAQLEGVALKAWGEICLRNGRP